MADVALATMLINSSSLPMFRKMQYRIVTGYVLAAATHCLHACHASFATHSQRVHLTLLGEI